jgi:hypothetical protein
MADPVGYNVDDLRRELGVLFMECKVRASREDQLVARIRELEAQLEEKAS